jgi:hypothetical protein
MYSVGFEFLRAAVVMKSSVLWDIRPCSPLKVNRYFGGTCRFHLQSRRISQERNGREAGSKQRYFTLLSCLTYSSILKMKATCSSETSVDIQRTTRRYIPEDRTLHYL